MTTNLIVLYDFGTNLVGTNFNAIVQANTSISLNEVAKAWGPVAMGFLGIITGLIIAQRQNALNIRQLEISKSKEEREEILKKLNTFYGPFKELRTQSKILYRKFAPSHREEYKNRGFRFRTLSYLIEGNTFSGQDAEILNQILQIDRELAKLIESHSGVVDKPELQELLGRLGAHIRILQLACEGKLSGPPAVFGDIVFPLPLDGAIESAILRLQHRLIEINDSAFATTKMVSNQIENSTTRFYDDNADWYAKETMFWDLSPLYARFLDQLPLWARILDAGCGVGRDTRYFVEHGNIVISFDASREIVRKCCEYPHAFCIHQSFSEINFKEEFDGVWACASLLHLTKREAKEAVSRLTTALKPGGVMFISLKEGKGSRRENGRFFQYYSEGELEDLENEGRLERLELWKSSALASDGCEQVNWLNLLLKRKSHFEVGAQI